MAKTRIAIIGGGASATLLLAHLARNPKSGEFSIDVYDRAARFGRGIAYSTTQECHLLNVRAANMSAYHEEKDDFAAWAAARGYKAEDFVPRKLFGDYLLEKLHDAQGKMDIRLVKEDVKESRKSGDQFEINGRQYDHAVLASGNVRALHLKKENADDCHDCPWGLDYAALKDASHVALVGSGLSAVDAAVGLREHGYKGKVTIISTHALLPRPHTEPASYAPFLTMREDEHLSPSRMMRRIRDEIDAAAEQGVPWQAVIDAMRGHTNIIWESWSASERASFLKHVVTFWNVHRHRMAPEIAAKLQSMNVEFVKARAERIESGKVILKGGKTIAADAVVNCLGYRYDEPDRNFEVSAKIGPACFGDMFETTAIPEIRMQAHQLAQEISA